MSKLYFVGDSITAGAWDERGGWAARLIGQIMALTIAQSQDGFYCLPYNLGVSGDTVPDVLARLAREIGARQGAGEPRDKTEIVFALGINDCLPPSEKPQFTEAQFRENLELLIVAARGLAHRISFIGLLPAEESEETMQRIARFETVIAETCAAATIRFLPLFERWLAMPDWRAYLHDGLHPNSAGHVLLAEQIGDFMIDDGFRRYHS